MINVNLIYDAKRFGWHRSSVILARPKAPKNTVSRRVANLALGLWMAAFAAVVVPSAPALAYKVMPGVTEKIAQKLGVVAEVEKSRFGEELYEEPVALPVFDESLPDENSLIIEKIGFVSAIGEGQDWVEAMKTGPWRVSEYGVPNQKGVPVILAAHRFGYIYWTNQFRREHSFYNLPKLEVGDRFEMVWDKRKYTYEIYEGYTDTLIRPESYEADVILYTCEVLNSDRRIVRLARRITT